MRFVAAASVVTIGLLVGFTAAYQFMNMGSSSTTQTTPGVQTAPSAQTAQPMPTRDGVYLATDAGFRELPFEQLKLGVRTVPDAGQEIAQRISYFTDADIVARLTASQRTLHAIGDDFSKLSVWKYEPDSEGRHVVYSQKYNEPKRQIEGTVVPPSAYKLTTEGTRGMSVEFIDLAKGSYILWVFSKADGFRSFPFANL